MSEAAPVRAGVLVLRRKCALAEVSLCREVSIWATWDSP